MRLSNLLKNLKESKQLNFKQFNPNIKGVSVDSKKIKKNYLFFAIKGKKKDGHQFINEAVKNGAVLVFIKNKESISYLKDQKTNFILTNKPRIILSKICSILYPNKPSFISAVTGTNGKTSVSYITNQIWEKCNYKSASIGTLGLISKNFKKNLVLTTSDNIELNKIMTFLKKKKIDKVCLEASSHGLEQNRIDNIKIKVAAFTNFSQDHLDYHKNLRSYFDSKMRLFKDILDNKGYAIINSDIQVSKKIEKICKKRRIEIISYGYNSNDLKLLDFRKYNDYQKVTLKYKQRIFHYKLKLFGDFQVYNSLCSLGIVTASGIPIQKSLKVIERIKQIPGRLEKINISNKLKNKKVSIYIDYAHTPDALEKTLESLKKNSPNNLSIVFGCGGDRDVGKRFLMGKIAKKYATKIYVTDDNPRNESALKIRKDILKGCPNARNIGDRYKAIKTAIKEAEFNEVLLVAGKGHESTQIIRNKIKDFDDKKVIIKILKKTR